MSRKKKRGVILIVLWSVGLLLISFPVFSQSLFPHLGGEPDLKSWALMFVVGALFTLALWLLKRIWEVMDKLSKSVERLTHESIKVREWKKISNQELKTYKHRLDYHWNWINQHDNLHVRCSACPEK